MKDKGRKTNYDKNIHPKLAKSLSIKGLTIRQIAESFGLSEPTMYKWKVKYPEFNTALEDGRAQATGEVVGALYKKAKGFYYWEKFYEVTRPDKFNKDGTPKKQPKGTKGRKASKPVFECVRKTRKYAQPDERAIEFYLTNRDKINWKVMTQLDANVKMDYEIIPPENPLEKKADKKEK